MANNVANVFAMMTNDEVITEDDQSMLEAWETASMASFDRDPLPTRLGQQFETTNMATEDTISQAMNESAWYHASNAPDMEVEDPEEPDPWNEYWSTFGRPFSKTPWRTPAATETGTNAATSSSDPSTAIGTTAASASHDPDATMPTSAAYASNASSTLMLPLLLPLSVPALPVEPDPRLLAKPKPRQSRQQHLRPRPQPNLPVAGGPK